MGNDFTSEFDGEVARLSIQHVYPEDEGEYTCVAYNELGKAFTSACLVVDGNLALKSNITFFVHTNFRDRYSNKIYVERERFSWREGETLRYGAKGKYACALEAFSLARARPNNSREYQASYTPHIPSARL